MNMVDCRKWVILLGCPYTSVFNNILSIVTWRGVALWVSMTWITDHSICMHFIFPIIFCRKWKNDRKRKLKNNCIELKEIASQLPRHWTIHFTYCGVKIDFTRSARYPKMLIFYITWNRNPFFISQGCMRSPFSIYFLPNYNLRPSFCIKWGIASK